MTEIEAPEGASIEFLHIVKLAGRVETIRELKVCIEILDDDSNRGECIVREQDWVFLTNIIVINKARIESALADGEGK